MSTQNTPDDKAQNTQSYLSKKLKKRISHEWWTITISLCVLSILITIYPNIFGIKKLENNLYDFYTNISAHDQPNPDITIITIDDNSLKEFGIWPWRRSVHAQLLDKLQLADAVILDFIFTEHSPFGISDDLILARAIKDHGKTYIPLVYNPVYGSTKPIDVLKDSAKGLGHINIPMDIDGIVRSFNPYIDYIGNTKIPHISAIALGLDSNSTTNNQQLISWSGPANTYTTTPYHLVLSDKTSPQDFKGKYVFVGAWSSGMGDIFNTPTTSNNTPMSGVEILANIADNLKSDSKIIKVNNYILILFNLLFVIFTCVSVRYFSPQRSFSLILFSLLFLFSTTTFIFYNFLIWIPPIASIVSIIIIYPIWSWRTQYAALQHIESELTFFISESTDLYSYNKKYKNKYNNSNFSRSLIIRNKILGEHTLIDLIESLHTTLENSRLSNIQRARLLNFLSHDMRSPLNAILALCELHKNNYTNQVEIVNNGLTPKSGFKLQTNDLEKFEYYAQRTLNLVDSFIDLNRAQISSMTLRDFDLGDLIINCCEESWIKAQAKNIKIHCAAVDYGYIINADYSLLQRVFINLINNAVQYSFENTQITVNLFYKNSRYIIEVIDQGCGISDNHLEAIFSPYSRVNKSSDMHKPGVGLGLAFVQTVIKRHKGTIKVESELSKGSNFIISLPTNQ